MDRRLPSAGASRLGFRGCLVMCVLLGSLLAGSGCTRPFYRKQADKEVNEVLAEKDRYPQWRIEKFHVYPDPRARFADPTDPDHPPMPPDDPAAWALSPHPQKPGKCGTEIVGGTGYLELLAKWDAQNRAEVEAREKAEKTKTAAGSAEKLPAPSAAENGKEPAPGEKASGYSTTILMAPRRPGAPRPYLLNLDQALELALINSREYQDAREDLYMTALPVTLQRFSFAAQFLAAEEAVRQWSGHEVPGGARNNWSLNSNAGVAKLFSTGALLLADFANQTVFNLGGGRSITSQSTINLDLVQPLLQGAGPAIALEPLTQSERNLLYQIRNYARFRKSLYVAIAGGGGGAITGANFQPIGVLTSPTFSPSSGLGGSGLFPAAPAVVPATGLAGLQVSPGQAGQILLQTALAAPVSGYLSTLLQSAQMQVDSYNIRKLESYLQLGRALQEGGDISQLQTDQFEQQLLGGRQKLLTDQQNYLQAIDQFKLQLGLPVDLDLELDDTPFRPLNAQFQKYEDLFNQFSEISKESLRYRAPEMALKVRKEFHRMFTTSEFVRPTRFRTLIESTWGGLEKLSEAELRKRNAALHDQRRRLLDKQSELQPKGETLNATDQKTLDDATFQIDVADFETGLREYESQPWKNVQDAAMRSRRQLEQYYAVVNQFIVVLIAARNERMRQLHEQWPVLARVCLNGVDLMAGDLEEAETAADQYALIHRLDLMNVRGQVVDAWRQIRIFANALLMPFNVNYNLSASTPAGANMPLAFSTSRTSQELVLNTALPLTRMRERNGYRASLINLQRARRILQRAEDGVAYDVRQELILLRQNLENYKIQTRQVELAYMTVEAALDTIQAPPSPGAISDVATRAASLTSQLIQAQNSLYQAHFTMTTIWISYLNTRDQLFRDLELMPLDTRGVWIDESSSGECGPTVVNVTAGSCSSGTENQRPTERLPEPQPVPNSAGQTDGHGR